MTTTELTFTQQRTLERNQKKAAEEKKLKQIKDAISDGKFADTLSGCHLVAPIHVEPLSKHHGALQYVLIGVRISYVLPRSYYQFA